MPQNNQIRLIPLNQLFIIKGFESLKFPLLMMIAWIKSSESDAKKNKKKFYGIKYSIKA